MRLTITQHCTFFYFLIFFIFGSIGNSVVYPSMSTAAGAQEPIPEYTAAEERRDSLLWRSVAIGDQEHRVDMKCIEPYRRVVSHGGEHAHAQMHAHRCTHARTHARTHTRTHTHTHTHTHRLTWPRVEAT
jgi:hypothetical protein